VLVTLSAAGIALTVLFPIEHAVTLRIREEMLAEDLFTFRERIDQFRKDHGRNPTSIDELVTERYIRKVPVDPFTHSSSTWRSVPEGGRGNGIKDVRSGSYEVAKDGTPYMRW
jgi:general secretion pathway protein G